MLSTVKQSLRHYLFSNSLRHYLFLKQPICPLDTAQAASSYTHLTCLTSSHTCPVVTILCCLQVLKRFFELWFWDTKPNLVRRLMRLLLTRQFMQSMHPCGQTYEEVGVLCVLCANGTTYAAWPRATGHCNSTEHLQWTSCHVHLCSGLLCTLDPAATKACCTVYTTAPLSCDVRKHCL